MARSNQYKYMEEEPIGPILLCLLCKRPFKDPRYTPCNHIVCCECISGGIETNWDPCPTCGKLVSVDSLSLVSDSLIYMLRKLRVRCTLCGQTGLSQENFDDHINKDCPNIHVPCPSTYIKCPWIGQRNQLSNHLSICIYQSLSSVFSELFAENRQLKMQYQEHHRHIQQLQSETQCQNATIKHIDQLLQQHQSQMNNLIDRIADLETVRPILPLPTPEIMMPSPTITINTSTNDKVILDVTPAWSESIKPIIPENIRFPPNYDETSPADVRTYNCLAAYRSMMKNPEKIDFVAEPFVSAVDNTETLIVALNELTNQCGTRLTFTHTDFTYNDSDYRTACGVTNLGSIHSFLGSEENFQTAKFKLHLNLNYDAIRASAETIKRFVLTLINDISSLAECNKEFIRVFDITPFSSVLVGFGITTPHHDTTAQVAESLKHKLNNISITQRRDIFRYLCPEQYNFKLEPALLLLQLQQSDFEPHYNRDYPDAHVKKRGGLPYYFPQGWYRHALKVVDKYPGDQVWLGMNNSPGEWAVAYHGTKSHAVRDITDKGLLHSSVTRDVMKTEAKQQNLSIPDVNGLYVATHCEGGASEYTTPFPVKDSENKIKNYRIVFQCRVQPGKFTEHTSAVNVGMAWRVFDEKAIRPYGILLKDS